MLTILRRVALALALVLPTTPVLAEPPEEGSVLQINTPLYACLTLDAAGKAAHTIVNSSDPDGSLAVDGCALVTPRVPVVVGPSHYAGMAMEAFDVPHHVWIILMIAGGQTRFIVYAEPLAEASSLRL